MKLKKGWIKCVVIGLLIFGFSKVGVAASYQIRGVYRAVGDKVEGGAHRRNLVVTSPDYYTRGAGLTFFGLDKDGQMRTQAFGLDEEGIEGGASEDQWKIAVKSLGNGDLQVSGELRIRGKEFERYQFSNRYRLTQNEKKLQQAAVALDQVYDTFKEIDRWESIDTLSKFKKIISLLCRRGVKLEAGGGTIPIPRYAYQRGALFSTEFADRMLTDPADSDYGKPMGTSKIEADLSDPISKWAKIHLRLPELKWATREEAQKEALSGLDSKVLAYYNPAEGVEGFLNGVLKKLAPKFIRFELVKVHYYRLNNGEVYSFKEFTWILRDGSSYSYSPQIEF